MQIQTIVAEQTSRNRYRQPAPLPPREIELTVRLQIPEETGADVGINANPGSPLPLEWDETLTQRLYQGVHGELASVGAPLPAGGIGVHITHLRISPELVSQSTQEDIRRLGEVLESLTTSTVAALWSGVNSLGVPSTP